MSSISKIFTYPLHISLIIYASIIVFLCSIYKPNYNWDMIGYVASAYKSDGNQGAELHKKTYDDVATSIPSQKFERLTNHEVPYLITVYTDPESLRQQIPFYSIRLAYVSTIRAVGLTGLSYAKSTIVVSATMAALCIVFFGLLAKNFNIPAWFFIISIFFARFIDLGRFSTPDPMAASMSLLSILLIAKRSPYSWFVISILPLFRTDCILVSLMLAAFLYCEGSRKKAFLICFLSLSVFKILNAYFDNYGWLKTFNFAFIKMDPYPESIKPSADINIYVNVYKNMLIELSKKAELYVWILTIILMVIKYSIKKLSRIDIIICLIPLAYIISHLTLFPMTERRFFIFADGLILLWIYLYVADLRSKRNGYRNASNTLENDEIFEIRNT